MHSSQKRLKSTPSKRYIIATNSRTLGSQPPNPLHSAVPRMSSVAARSTVILSSFMKLCTSPTPKHPPPDSRQHQQTQFPLAGHTDRTKGQTRTFPGRPQQPPSVHDARRIARSPIFIRSASAFRDWQFTQSRHQVTSRRRTHPSQWSIIDYVRNQCSSSSPPPPSSSLSFQIILLASYSPSPPPPPFSRSRTCYPVLQPTDNV